MAQLYLFYYTDFFATGICLDLTVFLFLGGKVVARLTSDSPALIGSNVTFSVALQFPRCQKENEDGDIVYQQGCANGI